MGVFGLRVRGRGFWGWWYECVRVEVFWGKGYAKRFVVVLGVWRVGNEEDVVFCGGVGCVEVM